MTRGCALGIVVRVGGVFARYGGGGGGGCGCDGGGDRGGVDGAAVVEWRTAELLCECLCFVVVDGIAADFLAGGREGSVVWSAGAC